MKNKNPFKNMNFLLIICIIVFGEIFAYCNELYYGAKFNNGKLFAPYTMRVKKFEQIYNEAKAKNFGKIYGKEYKGAPILLFGGSYVYGYGLKDDEKPAAKLANYLKKPVSNRAFQTWCVQNMLWQLKREDFYKEVAKPDYIIYTGIREDLENIYNPDVLNGLKYTSVNGELKEVPYLLMLPNNSYLYKKISHEISYRKTLNRTENLKFFNQHVLESKKEIDKHWGNVKMIVVWYDLPITEEFDELTQQGILVVSLDDFMKEKIYSNNNLTNSKEDYHPNSQAWDLIIPELAKRCGL